MARMTMTLLVALTAGWCASTVGVAHAHDEQSVRAVTRARRRGVRKRTRSWGYRI